MDKMKKTRKVKTLVKDLMVEFEEEYVIDLKTGEEVFDRDVEIDNDIRLYDVYKSQKKLLTSSEIKAIRNKYDMTQKEFALALGVGEITIHRFENGSIQTESVDSIIRLSDDPYIMYDLLIKNKDSFENDNFERLMNIIIELKKIKFHKIANFDYSDFDLCDFETISVEEVANELIYEYNNQIDLQAKKYGIEDFFVNSEYITHLKVQKLLYYIQGIALTIFNKPAFNSDICAWQYGPVVEKIYKKYRGRKSTIEVDKPSKVSNGLKKIIGIVIRDYGKIAPGSLIDLTHDEDPWRETDSSCVISIDKIKNYFDKVYHN